MAEPFVGAIHMFASTFAPKGYADCEGQLIPTSQNAALFSLLGTTYGGDGRTTFGLPDFRGRIPLHFGTGPGLTVRNIGSWFGQENVTLTTSEMPFHTHSPMASRDPGNSPSPEGRVFASDTVKMYKPSPPTNPITLNDATIAPAGGTQPHTNLMPTLTIRFCIATKGTYPSRNPT